MKTLKIEILIMPASHPTLGTGMELMIDNNIAETIEQFNEPTQRNIRAIFQVVARGVELVCQLNHEHATKMSMPVDSELGSQFAKRFKQPPTTEKPNETNES